MTPPYMDEDEIEEKTVLRAERQADETRAREADTRAVMGTPEGRRFIWWMISNPTGVFTASWSLDPHLTSHNEGRRAVGIHLVGELQRICPAAYLDMMREAVLDTIGPHGQA